MPSGHGCYITEPSGTGQLFIDCPYDEQFNAALQSLFPKPTWGPLGRRWEARATQKSIIISFARRCYDHVFYATDGDYEEV
jgi:hypothetical protein